MLVKFRAAAKPKPGIGKLKTEDGVNTPEDIEAEIWRHALDLAEPGGLGRLVEAEAVVQALILAAGRLAEHTGMPPALFCGHVVEAASDTPPEPMPPMFSGNTVSLAAYRTKLQPPTDAAFGSGQGNPPDTEDPDGS